LKGFPVRGVDWGWDGRRRKTLEDSREKLLRGGIGTDSRSAQEQREKSWFPLRGGAIGDFCHTPTTGKGDEEARESFWRKGYTESGVGAGGGAIFRIYLTNSAGDRIKNWKKYNNWLMG